MICSRQLDMASVCWARKRQLFSTEVLCRSFYFIFMHVSTVFLLGTELYFNSTFCCINYSRYLEYEFKRNEKHVLYIEDSLLDKRKFGVFKACFTERLAN